jgi:hypothetical protein
MQNNKMTPEQFAELCKKYGIVIENMLQISGILRLTKNFTPGSMEEYVAIDNEMTIIYEVPTTDSGSIWGTISDGIGGYSAVKNGQYVMNRSGCSKRWLAALKKLVA